MQGGSLALHGQQQQRLVNHYRNNGLASDTLVLDTVESGSLPGTYILQKKMIALQLYDFTLIEDRKWELPLRLSNNDLLKPSGLLSASPVLTLGALAIVVSAFTLIHCLPIAGNLLANGFSGFVAGIATVISSHRDLLAAGKLEEAFLSHGVLRAVSAGAYSGFIALASRFSTMCSMGGVALASLGAGLIAGICNRAILRANDCNDGTSIMSRLRARARQGWFTHDGLFGQAMSTGLADSIVQYEAFFLSYAGLVAAFPWIGLTFAGTAAAGAASGIASLAASAGLRGVQWLCNASWQWHGVRGSAHGVLSTCRRVVDICSAAAVKNSVFLVAYKAVFDGVACAF